jgi:hypothetical protein
MTVREQIRRWVQAHLNQVVNTAWAGDVGV